MNNMFDECRQLARQLAGLCTRAPFAMRAACFLNRSRTLFLLYHGVLRDTEKLESRTQVREADFRNQMAFLKDSFECITIDEALNRSRYRNKRPAVVVTFDDGYSNNAQIALPVLEEVGIPAIIYITTRNTLERQLFWPDRIWLSAKRSAVSKIALKIDGTVGTYPLNANGAEWQAQVHEIIEKVKRVDPTKTEEAVEKIVMRFKAAPGARLFDIEVESNPFAPLTVAQVSELASHRLITIGSHSHCHRLLNRIPLLEAEKSILESKTILEQITRKRVMHFAYPNGNLTPDIVEIVKAAGFRSAVSIPPGFFKHGDNPYFIKRFMVSADMSLDLFKAMLTGIFYFAKRLGL